MRLNLKNPRTCRNCSRELHTHTTDVMAYEQWIHWFILYQMFDEIKFQPKFWGIQIKITASIDQTGRNLFQRELPFPAAYGSNFSKNFAKSKLLALISEKISSADVSKRPEFCRHRFSKTKMNRNQAPQRTHRTSSSDVWLRDYTPRVNIKPCLQIFVETLQVISRTCNPLLFQNQILPKFREKFGGLWDWYRV